MAEESLAESNIPYIVMHAGRRGSWLQGHEMIGEHDGEDGWHAITNTTAPKISVVMPVHNTRRKYLCEALESILSQTYQNFEILVVDDYSIPSVKETVNSYTDERIKYFRLDRRSGAAIARNYAIDRAEGEVIAFLDSDDISLPDRLEKQLNFLINNPNIGCIGTAVREIGKRQGAIAYNPNSDIPFKLLFTGCVLCQSSVMLRKSILGRNNLRYDPAYVPAEDYAFWLELIGYTQFAVLPEVLTLYRSHSANISHTCRELQVENSGLAQVNAIEKYCCVKLENKKMWQRFFGVQALSPKELDALLEGIKILMKNINNQGYAEKDIRDAFRSKIKKHFYKIRTVRGQYALLHSRLGSFFNFPLKWKLFCFITRGIL